MVESLYLKLLYQIKKGEQVHCPKCGAELAYKGKKDFPVYIFCTNTKCNFKLIAN